MNIILRAISFFAIIANIAAVNPKDLVKVNSDNKQSCVEYYTYQGESYCSTKAQAPQAIDPEIYSYETQKIVFDQRPWQAVWGKKENNGITVEYVPLGDDINNWHELVTSQTFFGLQDKATPKEIADSMIKNIENAGFKPKVTFIKETPDTVLFEFSIDSPASQIQNEIQKITKGKDAIYVLHYVIKKKDMGSAARTLWIKNLTDSTIKP